jgi:MYXO-CTERM domain-containing protein
LKRFGDVTKAVSAYNAGPGNVRAGRPFVNPQYIVDVLKFYNAFKRAAHAAAPAAAAVALVALVVLFLRRRRTA